MKINLTIFKLKGIFVRSQAKLDKLKTDQCEIAGLRFSEQLIE